MVDLRSKYTSSTLARKSKLLLFDFFIKKHCSNKLSLSTITISDLC